MNLRNMQVNDNKNEQNQVFKLRLNERSILGAEKIEIKFLAVLEDSRCPEGADCLWEGNGKARFEMKKSGGEAEFFELNTNLAPTFQKLWEYEIKLLNLEPKPQLGIEIKKANYAATLFVCKNPSETFPNSLSADLD